jgi:O-antigen/teichoic acid export membrane protein
VLTLRLLLLAGIPRCLATFAIAEARAHREIGFIVRLRVQNFVVALGLSFLLAPQLGVSGMAIAWLSAQVLAGAVALRRLLKWSPHQVSPVGAPS